MKQLNTYISEALVKKHISYKYYPENIEQLEDIIRDKIANLIYDFNDINVSKIEKLDWVFNHIKNEAALDGKEIEWNKIMINAWDTSKCKSMNHMFYNCSKFNSDISAWNVSSCQNMSKMFDGCKAFNSNISAWNVSSCQNMSNMFSNASSFNQDLSRWNVSNVQNMGGMFYNCEKFNQNLDKWNVDTDNVDTKWMFLNCKQLKSTPTWYE